MEVEELIFNWHYTGSPSDEMGDDYSKYEVGKNGVISIREESDKVSGFSYVVTQKQDDGSLQFYRVFNPNHVTYVKKYKTTAKCLPN